MRNIVLLLVLGLAAACTGTTYRDTGRPIAAKRDFQPERYLGLWYEIARFPVIFEEGCTATTAEYGAIDADTISVLNTCRQGTPDGPVEQITGSAEIIAPGELKVRFSSVPFIAADYWVLWTDAAYQTAVVGVPSGSAGWILARTPSIDADTRAEAEAVLKENGYDPTLLYDVPQAAP